MRGEVSTTSRVSESGLRARALDSLARVTLRGAFRLLRVYWFVFRPRSHGAGVAVWASGRLLCVRNSYRRDLGLPGGRIQRHEAAQAAAARELREEVGIEVDPGVLNFVERIESRYEYRRDRWELFELVLEEEPGFSPDRREVIWAGFCLPGELEGEALSPVLAECLRHAPGFEAKL